MALEATDENFLQSLVIESRGDPTDPDRLWSTRAPSEIPAETFRLTATLRRGWFTLPMGSLLGVTVYDIGNNSPSAVKFDLYEPRRFGSDVDSRHFFDTDQDSTTKNIAVKGGLQVLQGPLDIDRSKDLRELIKEAHLQARSISDDILT